MFGMEETLEGEGVCEGAAAETPPVGDLTAVLQALGDPVRIEIVSSLAGADEPRTCGSFALGVTKSTLSHHFRVLREAGLISTRCEGTRRLISLRRADVDAAYPGLIDSIVRAALRQPVAAG
jgi:DNA-binding transcriptional ArsR family regulator